MMILEIKEIKQCRDKSYGTFVLVGQNRARINISMKLNKLVNEYGATLLHELLHFWMTALRKKGVRVTDKTEHKFIYAAEDKILKQMKKHFKRK